MISNNIRNPLNFINYCLILNLILILVLLILPPFNPFAGELAWGHKISGLSEIDEWLILFINIFLLPLIFLKKKNKFLKNTYSFIVLTSIPANFFSILIITIFFFIKLDFNIFIFSLLILFFSFQKKLKKKVYKFYYKNIIFFLVFFFIIVSIFSPYNFFINFFKNISVIEIYSIIISLIFIILFIKSLKNKIFLSKVKSYIIIFIISFLFLDISLNIDLLHAMAWISPAMSNFNLGHDLVAQYGFFTTFILKILIKTFSSTIDPIRIFSLLTIVFHFLSIFIIGAIFSKISKNNLNSLLYFIIFLFISTCAFSNLQITPSNFSYRFLPLIILIYYLLTNELKFSFKYIGFLVGLYFFWSFEVFIWSNIIILSLIAYIYLCEKNRFIFFSNIFKYFFYNIFIISIIFVIFYLNDYKILNYLDYLNLIFSYKNGWSIPPISYFVVPLIFLLIINFSIFNNYNFIIDRNLNSKKKFNIETFLLIIFVLNCFTYYIGRSTPTLFYINSWCFLIYLYYVINYFHNHINIKLLYLLALIILILPLSTGIKNTLFLNQYTGNVLLRSIIVNKFNILQIKNNFILETKTPYKNKMNINQQNGLAEIENLLNVISDEKIIVLVSQNLNSLSNLSFYYNNKKNFLPITYDLIDAHSKLRVSKILKYLDNIKENTKILTFTNLNYNKKSMHSMELLILNKILEKWKLCSIKNMDNFSIYKLTKNCSYQQN